MATLAEKAKAVEAKFDAGQQIFRRKSVEILLARIQSLEIAAQQQRAGGQGESSADPEFDQIVEDTVYGEGA